jgi:chromosomal replication initiator protein
MRGVPTSDIIKDIAPTIQPIKHHTTPKQVVERVARYYNIPSKELFGTSRVKDVKNARQVAMFLMNKDLNLSTTKIGDEFKKDHSTVIHGIRMVNDKIKTDFTLREQISELRSKIYAN